MEDDPQSVKRKRKRPFFRASSIGCFGFAALAVGWFVVIMARGSSYQPYIRPPHTLPANNGFDDFVAAGAIVRSNGGFRSLTNNRGKHIPGRDVPLLAANARALRLVQVGLTKECQAPVERESNDAEPRIYLVWDALWLYKLKTDVELRQGRIADAAGSALDAMQAASALTHNGSLRDAESCSLRAAFCRRNLADVIEHLDLPTTAAARNRMLTILQARPSLAALVTEQRFRTLAEVMTRYDTSPSGTQSSADPARIDESPTALYGRLEWKAHRAEALRQIEDSYRTLEREARLPASRRKEIPPPTDRIASWDSASITMLSDCDLAIARDRILLCALAIRCYRLQHRALPPSLDSLGLPPQQTRDPYTGEPLLYKPDGSAYLLYSVGPDRKDDGGQPEDENQNPRHGDIGICRYSSYYSQIDGTRPKGRPVPYMKLPPPLPAASSEPSMGGGSMGGASSTRPLGRLLGGGGE